MPEPHHIVALSATGFGDSRLNDHDFVNFHDGMSEEERDGALRCGCAEISRWKTSKGRSGDRAEDACQIEEDPVSCKFTKGGDDVLGNEMLRSSSGRNTWRCWLIEEDKACESREEQPEGYIRSSQSPR